MTNDENMPSKSVIGSHLLSEDSSFTDIVTQFVSGLAQRLDRMQEAIQAADFDALRMAAHQLKGCGGGYGYPILTERAAELECQAKAAALDSCLQALDELKAVCQRVIAAPSQE